MLKAIRYIWGISMILLAMTAKAENFTVVIDAGHGGRDIGAVGATSYEKDINLGVALKLGALIERNMPDVDIVYTRKADEYITLQDRADIANKAKGNLFISIHTNSVDKKAKGRLTVNGTATYTLGLHKTEANLAVARRENSVIALENDYTVKYQGFDPNLSESYIIFEISQNAHVEQSIDFASRVQKEMVSTASRHDDGVRQAGFWVLAKTSMPAVLVELDYICNPTQEQYLSSSEGQEQLAMAIYKAFNRYKAANEAKNAGGILAVKSKKRHRATTIREKAEIAEKITPASVEKEKGDTNSDVKIDANEYRYSTKRKASAWAVTDTKQIVQPRNVKKSATRQKSKEVVKKDADTPNIIQAKKTIVAAKPQVRKEKKQGAAKESINGQDIIVYKVQFLTSMKELATNSEELKGLKPVSYYIDNGLYKYTYGETPDKSEATFILREVKQKFKAAFIISFKNGKRVLN